MYLNRSLLHVLLIYGDFIKIIHRLLHHMNEEWATCYVVGWCHYTYI